MMTVNDHSTITPEVKSENKSATPSFFAKLAAVQAEIGVIAKDGKNPHFGSNYVTLDAITKKLVPTAAAHGLAVFQEVESQEGQTFLVTRVCDTDSAEQIINRYPLTWDAANPQKQGSAITYARRYSLGCIFQIATEDDDDGTRASMQQRQRRGGQAPPSTRSITAGQLTALQAEFHRTHIDQRKYLDYYHVDTLEQLTAYQAQKCLDSLAKKKKWVKATESQLATLKAEAERTDVGIEAIIGTYELNDLTDLSYAQADEVIARLKTYKSVDRASSDGDLAALVDETIVMPDGKVAH